jgi:flagellin-like hook-associated protein FlgL
MRANLISLQNIATETATTQQHLATGKKVNSALDNPTEFFASQNMLSQASSLSDLADGMSNGVQMIQAANTGITAIQGLLASAKSVAQSAIGNTGAVSAMNSASVSLTGIKAGDTVTVNGVVFTASNTMADQTAPGKFYIGAAGSENDNLAAANLAAAINNTGLNTAGAKDIQATSVTGSTINLASEAATPVNILNTDVTFTNATAGNNDGSVSLNAANDTLSQLMSQFTGIMNQIDKEAGDSGFQGINLLGGTNPNAVTINFGSSTGDGLALAGINASSTGLGTNLITANWGTDANVNTDIAKIDAATTTLNNYSSNLSSNLSIITDRQTFSTSMENVLQTGSSNLVNADTNQEGANMLMLQTQQSLGTTALSLASQSAQSVLKLFG